MLSSIKEFHKARLLKEAHEVEEKAKAEKGSRAKAEPEARYGSIHSSAGISYIPCASLGRVRWIVRFQGARKYCLPGMFASTSACRIIAGRMALLCLLCAAVPRYVVPGILLFHFC